MEYINHGVILRAQNFKDADRLYSILTIENGLIKVTAQAVKKIKSKLSGFLIPSNQVVLMLAANKSRFSRIAQVRVEQSYSPIVPNYDVFLLFSQTTEILLNTLKENLVEDNIYELTLFFLDDLSNKNLDLRRKELLQLVYFSQILKILGFRATKFNIQSKLLANFLEFLFKNDYLKNRNLMLKLKVRQNDFLILRKWFIEYFQYILEKKVNSFCSVSNVLN